MEAEDVGGFIQSVFLSSCHNVICILLKTSVHARPWSRGNAFSCCILVRARQGRGGTLGSIV